MSIKKISTPREDMEKQCLNPEHDLPMHIVLPPGRYEHTCPGCGKKTQFTVDRPRW